MLTVGLADNRHRRNSNRLSLIRVTTTTTPPTGVFQGPPEHPSWLEEAAMESVPEWQSPLFLHVDATDPEHVRLYFSAPAEAPTTRGFASIVATGLDGQSCDDILAVPDDFYVDLGLAKMISPPRMRHVGRADADQRWLRATGIARKNRHRSVLREGLLGNRP